VRFGVGLWCLQSTAAVPRHHVHAYRQLREDARLVESLGFDSVWLSEHHFFYDGYCPAVLPAAAGVLAVTGRLRVATGMLLAPLQRPERLAEAAAELAARSGGRLELGLGLGYRDVEFDGKGVPRRERVARLDAAIGCLEAAGGPRVWIGSATPTGVARAGARGQGILLSGANPLPLVRALAGAHRRAWEAAGRPGGTRPRVAALRNVWVLDGEAERPAVLDWYRASYLLYAGLGWTVAPGREHPGMDFVGAREEALAAAMATATVGDAGQAVQALREVAAAGVDDVIFRVVLEGCPRPALHRLLERLADRVLPELAEVAPPAAAAAGPAGAGPGGAGAGHVAPGGAGPGGAGAGHVAPGGAGPGGAGAGGA
jgi:alkanesulfonate monooxygenase SsuD/methylene tetrahydromethanopterin reductase-like flavin-dependent oxidoreductase (luciferase family)